LRQLCNQVLMEILNATSDLKDVQVNYKNRFIFVALILLHLMKNIIVTGASRGIGFALVNTLLQEECIHVIALSRNAQLLQNIPIHQKSKLTVLEMDITQHNYDDLIDLLSDQGVFALVNNAGALVNKPFEQITLTELQNIYNVNVFCAFTLSQLVLPHLQKSNGHICNITSMGGINGSAKFSGLSAYSSSKAALSVLTECLAEELKEKGVLVNAMALGAVQTEMLSEAFPGYQANVSPGEMANYLKRFILEDYRLFNGKIMQVSNSTP
jgi:3-oxoacyl-[acyl-carrier protein] reductase